MEIGEILGWVTTILDQTGMMPFVKAGIILYVTVAFVRRFFDR